MDSKMIVPFGFTLWPNLEHIDTLKTHIFEWIGKELFAEERREINGNIYYYVPTITADLTEDDMRFSKPKPEELCDLLESCALELENRGEVLIAKRLYKRAEKNDPFRLET